MMKTVRAHPRRRSSTSRPEFLLPHVARGDRDGASPLRPARATPSRCRTGLGLYGCVISKRYLAALYLLCVRPAKVGQGILLGTLVLPDEARLLKLLQLARPRGLRAAKRARQLRRAHGRVRLEVRKNAHVPFA